MNIKTIRISLIIALLFVSMGGFGLHTGIHPFMKEKEGIITYYYQNLVPFICGILSMILVTIFFFFKSKASYAYLITGMTVILGIITMAHFSIVNGRSLIADILVLVSKFWLAKAIYESYMIPEPTVAPQEVK